MPKTVDRDIFLNELNERVIGLTIAQSIIVSVLADISGEFTDVIEKRINQAVSKIPEEMCTPLVMEQIDYIRMSLGSSRESEKKYRVPQYLKILQGGKSESEK